MSQAKEGDTVKVHYTGKLDDGMVFDTSKNRDPLEFKIGSGQIIPGFEKEVIGMEEGETKSISIPPEDAYGQRRDELVVKVNKADFPENINPTVGQQLQIKQQDGNNINVVVADIANEEVTLDANHVLAGKTLNFEIELVSVG